MEKILIGSGAMIHHFPDYFRKQNDTDYAIKEGSNKRENGVEFLLNPVLFKYETNPIISPENLLTLKVSHLFWDINWEKHIFDALFLFEKGYEINKPFFKEMREYWEQNNPKVRRSNLNMNKEEFFSNAVNSDTNEHDMLHYILADVPAFTKILKDGCEVEVDEDKWNNLSELEKDEVVFEETSVMAWERYKNTPYKIAYLKQIKANIIKHFPEFIAIHAIRKYKELRKPMYNFKTKIENGLQTN